MTVYDYVFAGTYFHMLKVENRDVWRESTYIAVSAILGMVVSEVFILLTLSMALDISVLFGTKTRAALTVSALLVANFMLYLFRDRYVNVIRRFESDRVRARRNAAALHIAAFVSMAAFVATTI